MAMVMTVVTTLMFELKGWYLFEQCVCSFGSQLVRVCPSGVAEDHLVQTKVLRVSMVCVCVCVCLRVWGRVKNAPYRRIRCTHECNSPVLMYAKFMCMYVRMYACTRMYACMYLHPAVKSEETVRAQVQFFNCPFPPSLITIREVILSLHPLTLSPSPLTVSSHASPSPHRTCHIRGEWVYDCAYDSRDATCLM